MITLYNLEGEPVDEWDASQPIPSGRWTTPDGGRKWQMGEGPDQGGTYATAQTPVPTPAPAVPVTTTVSPVESRHIWVGRDSSNNDVYRMSDENGRILEWVVIRGDDSRNILPGTLMAYTGQITRVVTQNIESTSVTPVPVSPTLPATETANEFGHVYLGRNSDGNDVYGITDEAGQVKHWQVSPGDDSRAMIPGTLIDSSGAKAIGTGGESQPVTNPVSVPTGTPATPDTTRATSVATGTSASPDHVLVGKDVSGNNVFRLVDEAGTTLEWAVKPGDDSRNPIPGTMKIFNGSNSQAVVSVQPAVFNPDTQTVIGTLADTPHAGPAVSGGKNVLAELGPIIVASLAAYLLN